MAQSINRRAIRWLRGQLPALVSSGTITSESAVAIERYYESAEGRSRNFGFVVLASLGAALISAGIILLIAHNWDDLSRGVRTVIAFLPLVIAQILAGFVLLRRNESPPWRECVAIFDVAAVATAISLISQTYQIQGTFADFMTVWLLLSIPIVYLFRTTLGAIAYIIGCVVWMVAKTGWTFSKPEQLWFWPLLLLIIPYYIATLRRNARGWSTVSLSVFLIAAVAIGIGFTAEATQANLGGLAFAGFFAAVYLCGMKFSSAEDQRLSAMALIGGLGIGVTAIVLSFEDMWHFTHGPLISLTGGALLGATRVIGIAMELFFPIAAVLMLAIDYLRRRPVIFSIAAAMVPLVTALAWIVANLAPATGGPQDSAYTVTAALIFDVYALLLGIELIARGVRANSVARTNFGLLIIAALAIARFFDSDLGFLTRGLGFIFVGTGFLAANVILFKRKTA